MSDPIIFIIVKSHRLIFFIKITGSVMQYNKHYVYMLCVYMWRKRRGREYLFFLGSSLEIEDKVKNI